jgi:hypothetical protein
MTTKSRTGFSLTCPECGENDATIMLDLESLNECKCENCDERFSIVAAVKKASETLEAWRKIERLSELARQLAAE